MNTAIVAENLGKKYRVSRFAGCPRYRTLRESLAEAVSRPVRRWRERAGRDGANDFWALRDVNFEVRPGEVVGVIGHNGAGKSTLLKILSRITKPTTGQVALCGSVRSLLEVGTGFHPELTGRENIFLNGSILGMKRHEVVSRFPEMVAFAEIEDFLDTPVKHYSSGMYVRLAFAVAAHLDQEILLIDEVLAVGDASFQRRCLERMSELARSGKTILIVSHNMDLIPRFCQRALLLKRGRIDQEGPAGRVVQQYLAGLIDTSGEQDLSRKPRTGDGRARFTRLQLVDANGRPLLTHKSGDDLILRVDITSTREIPDVALAMVLLSAQGARIITSWTREVRFPVCLHPGLQTYECRFKNVSLRPGHRVGIQLWMATQTEIDCIENARLIEITDGEQTRHLSTAPSQGIVVCDYTWGRVPSDPGVV